MTMKDNRVVPGHNNRLRDRQRPDASVVSQ